MAKKTPKVLCNRDNSAARLVGDSPIAVETSAWFAWLEVPQNKAFTFEPYSTTSAPLWSFRGQKEERKGGWYWYAYKRTKGKLQRQYLGQGAELSLDKLLKASRELVAKFHKSSTTDSEVPQEEVAQEQPNELAALQEEIERLRSQLDDQAAKAGHWYETAKELEQEIDRLQSQQMPAADPEVVAILQKALTLKPNAGGAIKREIQKALELLTSADSQ